MDLVSLLLVQRRQLLGSWTLNTDTYPCYRFGNLAVLFFNITEKTEHAAHAMLVVGLQVAWRPRGER